MIVIGAMGLNGSGKDTLIDHLCQRCDVHKLSVGDIARQIAEEQGIEPTRENLHRISQQAMAEHGSDYFMRRVIETIEENRWQATGVSGIRTPEDIEIARKHFGDDLLLVHVRVNDARLRYQRLLERDRPRDPDTFEAFVQQEREEEEQFHVREALRQADLVINNYRSLEDFYQAIDYLLIDGLIDEEVECKI
jgi:dephospho-CoA kinase